MNIGIIGAMPEEIALIKSHMKVEKTHEIARRTYYEGTLLGIKTVLALSRIGKVSAATTTTIMLEQFQINHIIFTGVAGGIGNHVNIGDVIISNVLVQHDINAFPLFPKHEIPLLGVSLFHADHLLKKQITQACEELLTQHLYQSVDRLQLERFRITHPRIHTGTIASGDQFICDPNIAKGIATSIESIGAPPVLCVEMEGAACAQVCYEYQIPFVVVRTISDRADLAAPVNFSDFITHIARHFSYGTIHSYYSHLTNK